MSFLDQIKAAQSYSGSSRPKVGVGEYVVKLVAAEYGKNKAGNSYRGMTKWEVVEGEAATGLANTYITERRLDAKTAGLTQEMCNAQTASNIRPYVELLASTGYDVSKLEEDADSWQEVIANYINAVNKRILKGAEIVAKLSVKPNAKSPDNPYYNISVLPETPDVVAIPADIMAQLPGNPAVVGREMPAIAF